MQEFGVSRPTIRSALNVLETEGIIVRRWGVGTFVSEPPRISHPIAEAMDFHDLIAASGLKPGVQSGQSAIIKADVQQATDLAVDQGSALLRVEKVFTANKSPVILVVNLIPAWVLGEELLAEAVNRPEITEPIYRFLEERCRQKITYHIATLQAESVQGFEIPIPGAVPLTPMLVMKSVAFNADERTVFRSTSAYPDGRVQLKLVRRRS